MSIEEIIPYIKRYNRINGIEDNIRTAAEQVAIIASDYYKNQEYKTEQECLSAAYWLYFRSFDSTKAAIMFNQMLGYGQK